VTKHELSWNLELGVGLEINGPLIYVVFCQKTVGVKWNSKL